MYRTLIVEDEADEARRLSDFVRRYGETRGEVFQLTWLKSAMEMLSDHGHYDLVVQCQHVVYTLRVTDREASRML